MPRYAAAAAELRAALPADVRATLDRHEAAGTLDSEDYQAAYMRFFGRHICRLDPWPDAASRTFAQLNQTIYERMQGPNELLITGIHKDYDCTPRLSELTMPTETVWYHSLLPAAEMIVFEHSSHLPHLEEPEPYQRAIRDFLKRSDAAAPPTQP
jgi:proline-specific peptidase